MRNPGFRWINFVRDSLILGIGYFLTEDVRLYSEADWAFKTDGGEQPWEFQFGAEYSPVRDTGFRGSPFFAVNAHVRESVDGAVR